jgi:hypothetical protein
MKIEVSNGEVLDKLSILDIKLENIKDKDKIKNIKAEWKYLKMCAANVYCDYSLYSQLYNINKKLWHIEDLIREKEKKQEFDEEFIILARSVYITNDERSEIKKEINLITNSKFLEEKSYNKYK